MVLLTMRRLTDQVGEAFRRLEAVGSGREGATGEGQKPHTAVGSSAPARGVVACHPKPPRITEIGSRLRRDRC